MIFRFILSHEILGSKEISEPIGWLQTKLTIERHKDFGSLVEYFNGTFTFYGFDGENDGGIDFIRQVEQTYGVDAYLGITIEVAPDNYVFQNVFTGQLDLSTINEITDNKAEIAIIRDDFWAKFINRYETPVNIQSDESLDGETVTVFEHVNLRLTSQIIQKRTIARFSKEDSILPPNDRNNGWVVIGTIGGDRYAQIDWPTHDVAEVTEEYSLPVGVNPNVPVSKFIMEYPGEYRIKLIVDTHGLAYPSSSADLLIQFNDEPPITASTLNYIVSPQFYTRYELDVTHIFSGYAGTVKIYFDRSDTTQGFFVHYEGLDVVHGNYTFNNINVLAKTSANPTDANSFLVHDVAGSISDRVTSQDESFYSELLGSDRTKYRQYDENGCRWSNVLIQGLQIRQYNLIEKPYSLSMKKWFEGINPITPLSLMYDEIEDRQVIRVEDREFCFDATNTSVDLNFVRNIVRKYDPDLLYKTVKTGFKKWESENISGIDDPQTKHTYATQLKRTGKDLTLESELIAASLSIENTRRTTREKSADYKFDNDSFIVSINPNPQTVSPDLSPDIEDYIPELDENFTSITGLLNPETRYNSRYTPGRSLLRWLKFLSGSLFQYVNSPFKFTYGEGNYAMESTLVDPCEPDPETLAENQDIISVDPVHLPFEYEFTDVPLDYDEYRLIADNRTQAIGISQTDDNHTKFFIKKLEYDIVQGQANISAWPTTWMDIMVIEGEFALKDCNPDVLPDGCYRITEDGDFRITESGDYRILEDC